VQSGRFHRWAFAGFAFRAVVALFVLAVLGFPIFVWSLPRASSAPAPADAIVALTGGEGRLAAALELLELGKGQRLLISGVHTSTTRDELFAAVGQLPVRAACCVDLGRGAENTIGNAGETAVWVKTHGYHSIIVVTATYHMPRSLMELRAVMPETELVPYPVFPDRVRLSEWWSDPETTGVLAGEYFKFLASTVRVGVATRFGTQPAAAPDQAIIEDAPGDAPEPPDSATQDLSTGWVAGQH